jgi:hypothetical protein
MGFNAEPAGFRDVEDMVQRMLRHEDEQILGMASFMRTSEMHSALQRRDGAAFAHGYNDPNFAISRYDQKLAAAYASLAGGTRPGFDACAVRLPLAYRGFDAGPIDDFLGNKTRTAIAAFAVRHGLPVMPAHQSELYTALRELPPPTQSKPGDGNSAE